MKFLTPTEPFTHRARLYGIPCYINLEDGQNTVGGTNVLFDWMIEHVAPIIHAIREQVCAWRDGEDYEPGDWPFEIRGEIR